MLAASVINSFAKIVVQQL